MAAGAGVDSCAAALAANRSEGRRWIQRPMLLGRRLSEIYNHTFQYMLCVLPISVQLFKTHGYKFIHSINYYSDPSEESVNSESSKPAIMYIPLTGAFKVSPLVF